MSLKTREIGGESGQKGDASGAPDRGGSHPSDGAFLTNRTTTRLKLP